MKLVSDKIKGYYMFSPSIATWLFALYYLAKFTGFACIYYIWFGICLLAVYCKCKATVVMQDCTVEYEFSAFICVLLG